MRIRNTFNPLHAGTLLGAATQSGTDAAQRTPAKGLSVVRGLALLTLEGAGMIGVPGTAERTFGALHATGISVVMISQGSSEHSICCVVREADAQTAALALRRAFTAETARGEIHSVSVASDISVLAAVGDAMAGQPGVAARLFGALARTGVNIRAIAQGASERNISVAVAAADTARALRATHAAFWLSPQTLSIGLIGPGKVGTALLEQLHATRARLRDQHQLDLRLRAIASSRRMWLGEADAAAGWNARVRSRRRLRHRCIHASCPGRPSAPCGHHRLQRERRDCRALRRMAGRGHPRGHAKQARRRGRGRSLARDPRRGPRLARVSATRRRSVPDCR